MSFPFPQLLAFLKEEKDQTEFMKIAAEVGLGSGDIELAKLLLTLQLYKGYYAAMPRAIKAVHEDALGQIRRLRDETSAMSDRTRENVEVIGQWFEEINLALHHIEPKALAEIAHKRLLDATVEILGGSLQAIATAKGQIETATQQMNAAGQQAAFAIQEWQTVSLRRVWGIAFGVCMGVASLVTACVWFVFLRQ